jgi:hypothetical protein
MVSTKIINKQGGFTPLETILMVVVAVLIVGVGVYVYDHRKTATDNAVKNSSTTTTATTTSKPDTAKAKATLQEFYDAYLQAAGTGPDSAPDSAKMKALVKQYGTSDFLTTYTNAERNFDPVMCAQDAPTSVIVDSVTASGNGFDGQVHGTYSGGPSRMGVKLDSSYKIKSITCPDLQ